MTRTAHHLRQIEWYNALKQYGNAEIEPCIKIDESTIFPDVYLNIQNKAELFVEIGNIDKPDKKTILNQYLKLNKNAVLIHEPYGFDKLPQIIEFFNKLFNSPEALKREAEEKERLRLEAEEMEQLRIKWEREKAIKEAEYRRNNKINLIVIAGICIFAIALLFFSPYLNQINTNIEQLATNSDSWECQNCHRIITYKTVGQFNSDVNLFCPFCKTANPAFTYKP